MYEFPKSTVVNKDLRVIDVLRQIKANLEVKNDSKIIDFLTLSNIINNDSLNCGADELIKQIYVFNIKLNKREIPNKFIEALDKTIRFHTYYIFTFHEESFTQIAFKDIGKEVILGKYYFHPFNKYKTMEFPDKSNLNSIYRSLLSYEIDIPYRKEEKTSDFLRRINIIHRLEFQISKTESAIKYQLQPKKKYQYHQRLLQYKKDLELLTK
jgi:hypothetical protein